MELNKKNVSKYHQLNAENHPTVITIGNGRKRVVHSETFNTLPSFTRVARWQLFDVPVIVVRSSQHSGHHVLQYQCITDSTST